jgi:uncharacterized membrane protein
MGWIVLGWLEPLIIVTALGCGLIAGAFFAFSSFVMGALARLPAAHGIAAMQSINVVVINPVFLGVFVGTALCCLLLAGVSVWLWPDARAPWLMAGGLAYVIGTFVVTMRFNVPRNDALDTHAPDSADGAAYWQRYLEEWTSWNTVRTIAALVAAACLTVAAS